MNTRKVLIEGSIERGLYQVLIDLAQSRNEILNVEKVPLEVWHQRLGCLNYETLHILAHEKVICVSNPIIGVNLYVNHV